MQLANESAGLFFSQEDLQLARENFDREPIRSAAALLDLPNVDPLAAAQLAALRYQLQGDASSGSRAIAALVDSPAADDDGDLDALQALLNRLSTIAMLRDHPDWLPLHHENLAAIKASLPDIHRADVEKRPLHELWLAATTMADGILQGSENDFEEAAAVYRRAVDQRIHPEGYLNGIVDIEGARQTFAMQVSGTCALIVMAEMAGQVGVDLWSYDNRAVSVVTAATYTLFYYFYPERWRWEEGLTSDRSEYIIRREGAFLEMVNRRHPLRGIEQLFAEQRPLYCSWGGGLTSLTHGLKPDKKKRWRLW